MEIPTSIFDAFMGGYDPGNDMASQQLSEHHRRILNQQGLNTMAAQFNQPTNSAKPVNPEPNPVLLLLE